jgi:hypothetical protein
MTSWPPALEDKDKLSCPEYLRLIVDSDRGRRPRVLHLASTLGDVYCFVRYAADSPTVLILGVGSPEPPIAPD